MSFAVVAADNFEIVENDRYRLVVDPLGGRLRSVYSKTVGADFTVTNSAFMTESSWDRWKSRGQLAKTAFLMKAKAEDGTLTVTAAGQTGAGGIPFLKVAKRYRSTPDSTALQIDYKFINTPEAMSLQPYAPSLDMAFVRPDTLVRYFYPTTDGICAVGQRERSSFTSDAPSRGWFAAVDDAGKGAVLTIPFEELSGFYCWLPGISGLQLKLIPVGIEDGKAHAVSLELIPFDGLKVISGAGGGLVGMLDGGICRVINSREGAIVAAFDGREEKLVFREPGDAVEFKTTAKTVRLLKDGAEVCRLDAKPAKGPWTLEPLSPRRTSFKCEADLSCYTNFPSMGLRPWAKPLKGGKVKVSVLSGQGNLLEVGGLAECFDMDYRTIGVIVNDGRPRSFCNPIYSFGDHFGQVGPADLEREVNKVLSWPEADVLLLGGVPLDALPISTLKIVKERVAKGTGLVLVGKDDRAKVDFGDGRVVRLEYPAAFRVGGWWMCGLTPNLSDFYPDKSAEFEHYYSRVAHAVLQAAGRTPKTARGTCEWVAYNAFREKLAEGHGSLPKPTELPPFAGPISVEYTVREGGKVVDWGERVVTNAPSVAIVGLEPAGGFVHEGDELNVSVELTGDTMGGTVRLRFIDVHGRTLVDRIEAAAPSVKASFRVENGVLAYSYRIVAELLQGGRIVSRRQALLSARPKSDKLVWDDYEIGTSGNSETRAYLYPHLARMYKNAMIASLTGQWPVTDGLAPHFNFHTSLSTHIGLQREPEPPAFAKTGDKTKLVRRNCLSRSALLEKNAAYFRSLADYIPHKAFRHHGFGDEMSLTGHEGTPIDFCFSEDCLREFRKFAKARYATLEKLNEAYESDFPDWDAVMPFTRQEVWKADGRHVAGWADHLEFMDDRVTNALWNAVSVLHPMDPEMRFSLSGTQPPAAYTGMDWSKILQVLDCTLAYGLRGQYDIHRSFRPDGRYSPWAIGYGTRGKNAVNALWASVFHGCNGNMGWWARSQFSPDMRPTHIVSDVQTDQERLSQGIGKYLINCLSIDHDIAILYSQASYRGAFIEERDAEHTQLEERCRRLLRNLGVSFDYISYDRLAKEGVDGYKVLVLVDANAMSDREVERVKSFAANGGCVLAVKEPARRDYNCRVRAKPAFDGFFDGRRKVLLAPGRDLEDDRAPLRTALNGFGIATDMLKVAARNNGFVEDASVFAKRDGQGNLFWGVIAQDFEGRTARVTFPKVGYVCDLVTGKGYGKCASVDVTWGKGFPHAFLLLDAPTGVKVVSVKGTKVSFDCGSSVDTVLRVTVKRPDGSAVECYARNVLARDGKASYGLPFALSDPAGKWLVTATNVLSGETASCTVEKGDWSCERD